NELASVGLEYWTAQYAYVPLLKSDSLHERFAWSLGGYSLGLNLISRYAYFTDIPTKWSRVPRAEQLPDARLRLSTLAGGEVWGAGIITSEENITHTLRTSHRMSLAERLEQLLSNEGDVAFRAARLASLEVQVPGTTATAHIDFNRSVVRASAAIP